MPETFTPPRGASLLLRLFTGETDYPQIEGDLREEYHQHALSAGAAGARQWYWHEAIRNVWVLASSGTTLRTILAASLGAVGLCWAPRLLYFGQHLANAVFSALVMHQPLWDFVSNYFWRVIQLRNTPFAIVLSPFDPWVLPLFRAVSAFCFGALACRAFPGRDWLLRLAFITASIALLAYLPAHVVLYAGCWFLLGTVWQVRRMRRLAV